MVENSFQTKEKCMKEDDIGPIDFTEHEQARSNCVIESTKKKEKKNRSDDNGVDITQCEFLTCEKKQSTTT